MAEPLVNLQPTTPPEPAPHPAASDPRPPAPLYPHIIGLLGGPETSLREPQPDTYCAAHQSPPQPADPATPPTPLRARLKAARASARASARRVGRGFLLLAAWLLDQVPEALLFGGAAAITYGVALTFRPGPAWITGGVLAIVFGWRLGRSSVAPTAPPTGGQRG
jgi:hypothetical protein